MIFKFYIPILRVFLISELKVMNFWGLFWGVKHLSKTTRMERGVITAGGKGQRIQAVILSAIFFDANCTCSVIFVVINILVVLCFSCFFSGTSITCETFLFCCSYRRANKGTNYWNYWNVGKLLAIGFWIFVGEHVFETSKKQLHWTSSAEGIIYNISTCHLHPVILHGSSYKWDQFLRKIKVDANVR